MAKCDKVLTSLSAKVKVVIDIGFQSNMGDKAWWGLVRSNKMWQDMMGFGYLM